MPRESDISKGRHDSRPYGSCLAYLRCDVELNACSHACVGLTDATSEPSCYLRSQRPRQRKSILLRTCMNTVLSAEPVRTRIHPAKSPNRKAKGKTIG
jgi:hypothetical protein